MGSHGERVADQVDLAEIEAVAVIPHHIVLVVIGRILIHFADILTFPLIHVGEVHEDTSFEFASAEGVEHAESGFTIKSIAVLALDNFFALHVVEP